jgi:hypothetical protein
MGSGCERSGDALGNPDVELCNSPAPSLRMPRFNSAWFGQKCYHAGEAPATMILKLLNPTIHLNSRQVRRGSSITLQGFRPLQSTPCSLRGLSVWLGKLGSALTGLGRHVTTVESTASDQTWWRSVIRRLAWWWKQARMLYQVLVLVRFSLLLGVVCALVMLLNDQAQDVLRLLGEDTGWPVVWLT